MALAANAFCSIEKKKYWKQLTNLDLRIKNIKGLLYCFDIKIIIIIYSNEISNSISKFFARACTYI